MTPPPEAFWSRLHKIRIAFDLATLETVAAAVLAAYGIRDGARSTTEKLAKATAAAMATSRQKCKEGALAYPVDIRLLERAARHAHSADSDTVAEHLAQTMADSLPAWDGDLGDTLPQSAAAAAEIAAAFRKALALI